MIRIALTAISATTFAQSALAHPGHLVEIVDGHAHSAQYGALFLLPVAALMIYMALRTRTRGM